MLRTARHKPAQDDDDLSSMFKARKALQADQRADKRHTNTQALVASGVFFTSHNMGAHLIVAERWDFWPGTERWRERKGRKGHSIREGCKLAKLLNVIKEDGDA